MRESSIEAYFIQQVAKLGGQQRKTQWIGRNGAPDRFVMMPGGNFWVELKNPKTIEAFPANAHERMQEREHELMRAAGERVYVVGTKQSIDLLLESFRGN